MSEPGERRGEQTREAILDAAEIVFAEHGFDGARIDTIADVSGFNKTLIFRYFGDKLGLYAAVLRRIDKQAVEIQAQLLGPMLADETLTSDAHRFRAFLKPALAACRRERNSSPAHASRSSSAHIAQGRGKGISTHLWVTPIERILLR